MLRKRFEFTTIHATPPTAASPATHECPPPPPPNGGGGGPPNSGPPAPVLVPLFCVQDGFTHGTAQCADGSYAQVSAVQRCVYMTTGGATTVVSKSVVLRRNCSDPPVSIPEGLA